MSPIRVATNRKRIVKFEGCYHGHSDGLLVKVGSGIATLGIPSPAGVPEEITSLTLALPFNDLRAVQQALVDYPDQIAAIILEPVVGNTDCILPAVGYLEGLRELTHQHGTNLIVDEVMTGFRLTLGGALERYGFDAELVTLGKIIGGVLPSGACGGKLRFMELLAPLGPIYQAGTLSGNPLAMAAHQAQLSYLLDHTAEVYPKLEATAEAVFEGVAADAAKAGIPITLNRVGAMVPGSSPKSLSTTTQTPPPATPPNSAHSTAPCSRPGSGTPGRYEAAFLSTAHAPAKIHSTLTTTRKAFIGL